ncbi:hypothetical protein J6Z39_04085 [bacterium]|nr:hypothetical protein [bacterium]
MWKKTLFALSVPLFLISCEDALLPDLPDMEGTVDVDAWVVDEDSAETGSDTDLPEPEDADSEPQDGDIEPSDAAGDTELPAEPAEPLDLAVVMIGGYEVPYSGKVYYAAGENISDLREVPLETGIGSGTGTDPNLALWRDGFAVIERYYSDDIYLFSPADGAYSLVRTVALSDAMTNLQDAAYDKAHDRLFVSALNTNSLFVLDNGGISELVLTLDPSPNPAKMRIIGDKLYVVLQHLNDQWYSTKSELAMVDLETLETELVEVPTKNIVSKIEYNPEFDRNHCYFLATGKWQKRDGALLRFDLETRKSEVVLNESPEENNLLDGDFVDLSIADNGDFYIIFSNNRDRWINKLLRYVPSEGKVYEIESGAVNAFAANPIDYSRATGKIYYFIDIQADTFLRSLDTKTGQTETVPVENAPAALKLI